MGQNVGLRFGEETGMTLSTLFWLDAFVSSDSLSELVGRPTRATRIRVKANTSLMAAIRSETGAQEELGLARILWPTSLTKARRARAAARAARLDLVERELPGGLLFQTGPLSTDPRLAPHIVNAALSPDATWLRHNPLRRALAADQAAIVRISAAAHNTLIAIEEELSDLPLPAYEPLVNPAEAIHVSRRELVDGHDLSSAAPLVAHEQAGEILARLHRHEAPRAARRSKRSIGKTLAKHRSVLGPLAPSLAARIEALDPEAGTLSGEAVFSHGDASPDQFLLDGHKRVWITDFDRACCAPRSLDLASYSHCSTPEQAEALLTGYRRAGGRTPTAEELRRGRILAAIDRLLDPLRDAQPTWRRDIAASLELLERLMR